VDGHAAHDDPLARGQTAMDAANRHLDTGEINSAPKRYPSIFVYESDGFRKELNPFYELEQDRGHRSYSHKYQDARPAL
jgi:hypothetical protein